MDIRRIFSVQVRKEGSDKVLIYVDNLNEAEGDKVFKELKFATKGEGYEKLLLMEEMILRRQSLK